MEDFEEGEVGDLDDTFFEKLEQHLRTLPSVEERRERHESWMTAEQIQSWSGTKHTPEEIDQALLDRWRRDQLVNIRPAKYPSLTTLSRLWGHIERVRYLDRGQLEPRRLDEPLVLEPLDLPADVSEVFVSFSALDLELAVNVRRILANRGIRAWLYEERIKQRDLVFEQVRSAISNCSGVIGLLTRNSVGSA